MDSHGKQIGLSGVEFALSCGMNGVHLSGLVDYLLEYKRRQVRFLNLIDLCM